MEAVMTLVMKYCSKELDDFSQCVTDNPGTWQTRCEDLRERVTTCTSSNPMVKKINKTCANQFQSYDNCLKANPEDVTVCIDELQTFMQCAEFAATHTSNDADNG